MARPRDPDIDRRVVAACVELLGEIGRARLTRAAIAERAGVSLPAVTRRYPDVDAVLLEVARTPGRPPADDAAVASLRDFLVASLRASVAATTAPALRRQAGELMAAATGHPALDATFRATLSELRRPGLAWVERARASGEVRADVDGELLLDLLAGAVYYRLLWRGETFGADDVEAVVDALLLGVAPRPVP